jgi:hypothetical protein
MEVLLFAAALAACLFLVGLPVSASIVGFWCVLGVVVLHV